MTFRLPNPDQCIPCVLSLVGRNRGVKTLTNQPFRIMMDSTCIAAVVRLAHPLWDIKKLSPPASLAQEASYMHVTPPYYGGQAEAEFVFTASYDGRPALTDILGNLQINYLRQDASGTQTYVTASGYSAGGSSTGTRGYGITKIYGASGFTPGYFGPPSPGIMHLDACYNFTEALPEVVSGTTEQKFRWMIQSKFETPILNVQSSSVPGGWSPAPPLPSPRTAALLQLPPILCVLKVCGTSSAEHRRQHKKECLYPFKILKVVLNNRYREVPW